MTSAGHLPPVVVSRAGNATLLSVPPGPPLGTFTVLGRTMPLYICFVYPWYVGGLGYLAYKLFSNGITTRGLFQLWALDAVADVGLESPGILLGTYSYYGHQPLNPWGFPLWWAFVNPTMPMLAGMAIF